MKVGNRTLSFKKCIATRTSWRRYARQSIGLKVPRGYGWLTTPKKALYNHSHRQNEGGGLIKSFFWLYL